LLVNDGNGVFADETDGRLSAVRNTANSFTIRFVDLDSDCDADILSPDNSVGQGGSIDVWLNDGSGVFAPAPPGIFSPPPSGSAFNIQIVDVNADGKDDIYFCYRTGTDQMYMRQ
jgi:hypothetical protein